MTDTSLDIDLSALVGEMPVVPCEHPQHEELHGDLPAVVYVRGECVPCDMTTLYPACQCVVDAIERNIKMMHPPCGTVATAKDFLEIVGKV